MIKTCSPRRKQGKCNEDVIPVTVVNMQWKRIPENIKEKILANVWCSSCREGVLVADYKIENHDFGLGIRGKCCNVVMK